MMTKNYRNIDFLFSACLALVILPLLFPADRCCSVPSSRGLVASSNHSDGSDFRDYLPSSSCISQPNYSYPNFWQRHHCRSKSTLTPRTEPTMAEVSLTRESPFTRRCLSIINRVLQTREQKDNIAHLIQLEKSLAKLVQRESRLRYILWTYKAAHRNATFAPDVKAETSRWKAELKAINNKYSTEKHEVRTIVMERLPRQAVREWYLRRLDPDWHMTEHLTLDCIKHGGCCSRRCGCCRAKRSSTRDNPYAHCTIECGCCLLNRFADMGALDVSPWIKETPKKIDFAMEQAYIWEV